MLFEVISRLDRNRFEPHVISLNSPGGYAERLEAIGVPVRSIHMRGIPSPRQVRVLRSWIRDPAPDLVHAFLFKAVQTARIAAWTLNVPILSSPRINYRSLPGWAQSVDRLLRRRDTASLAESNATRQYLLSRLGYPSQSVYVIQNGVDADNWCLDPKERTRMRDELNVGRGRLIVAVGRLVPQKGFSYLLRALSAVTVDIPWQAVIVGSGPLYEALGKEIGDLQLQRQVRLLGERRDVLSLLSAADLFVLPSLWEGMPNAVLEAAACGLPIVATNVDGTPEILTDGENGLLVNPFQVEPLAVAITRLLRDLALAQRLGQAARNRVVEAFDLRMTAMRYQQLYDELIAGDGRT